MKLSIRARLTAWYTAVLVAALVAGGVAIAQVQVQIARTGLDDELSRLRETVMAVLHNEFGEGLDLPGAVQEASMEVVAAGRTIIVADDRGTTLQVWGDPLPVAWQLPVAAGDITSDVTLGRGTYRLVQARAADGGHTFVVGTLASRRVADHAQEELLEALSVGIGVALAIAVVGGWLGGRHVIEPAALDAQRQFMADASHQLRTPVSIIRTTAQVILGKPERSDAEYRESMTIVGEQSERLARLVDAMFLLSRADAGWRTIRRQPIYIDELVAECVRGLAVIAAQRRVRLEVDGASDVSVAGDEDLLRQMIVNLLENAIRHTGEGGRVRTTVAVEERFVAIRVEDEGPGIAVEDRERIFERFVRLHQSSDGAGLGLPTARWIAQAHGGELVLETSVAGSVFVVRLRRDVVDQA